LIRRQFVGVLVSICGVVAPLEAAVHQRDWKSIGDGLITFDDVNNREWLDLSVTHPTGLTWVLSEVEVGGVLAGFAVAEFAEVRALAQSAGIDTTTLDYDVNHVAALSLIGLLGETGAGGVNRSVPGEAYSAGWVNPTFVHGSGAVYANYYSILADDANVTLPGSTGIAAMAGLSAPYSAPASGGGDAPGVWLYRLVPSVTVPEPAMATLLASAGLAPMLHRRRYSKPKSDVS
jgi:hypothetical protein